MSNRIILFQEQYPSLESYWRSLILFGRNVASYKFALAKSLLDITANGTNTVTLEELAEPFSMHLCEHLTHSPKQITSKSSKFLNACIEFNNGAISHDALIDTTIKMGFINVIDAFHVVNYDNIPIEFYQKDYTNGIKRIILTDNLYKLKETAYSMNFNQEVEARWNLVETSWELGVSRNLLNVEYDESKHSFFMIAENKRRKDVTSARSALNGYQKGKCFYCFDDITINSGDELLCDVDHYYPYILQQTLKAFNLNGIWNLVLTCNKCNRGANGKLAKIPAVKYLERLHRRNEYLINSHHPLRETLINQTGRAENDRIKFLLEMDNFAISKLIHRWEVDLKREIVF